MHLQEFDRLVQIMKRLRKECPWDREQTPETLRQYLLEEAYETIEAIDGENWNELKKELGDLLLQIVFQAEIAEEKKRFALPDVIDHINNKLIERHPHVFGDVSVKDARDVKHNWEQIKVKNEKRKSILEGVPRNLSALLRAQRLQDKASHVGFDWENPGDVLDKIREEIEELQRSSTPEEIEEEMGDLLFSLVNLSRFYSLSAEDALRKTTNKFVSRFQYIEQKAAAEGLNLNDMSLVEMDRLWEEAKSHHKAKSDTPVKKPAKIGESLDEKIAHFSTEIANFPDAQNLWPYVANFCKEIFGISHSAIFAAQYDVIPYRLDYVEGFSDAELKTLLTDERYALLEVLETERQILNKADIAVDNPVFTIMDQLHISMAIPITRQAKLMAVILLGSDTRITSLPSRSPHFFRLMSSQLAIALANIHNIQETVQSQKMSDLGIFASQLAHDFRSFISLIKNLNRENERLTKHANYMEKMVQDLLNYARPKELKLAPININDLIDITLELLHAPDNVKIEKHYASELPKLHLDKLQMRRVFSILFENSIRAMKSHENGCLKITTGELRPLSKFRHAPWVQVEILDDGIGIQEEYLERIFDPFFTTRKNEGGNGLGLAIARQIISRHSGFIDVSSTPGKGTNFNIRLPHQNV